jgi:hypothetical protein
METGRLAGVVRPGCGFCGHRLFKGPPWLFRCELKAIADGWACPCVRELSLWSQAKEGHLVDALVPRGDEGRGTLR